MKKSSLLVSSLFEPGENLGFHYHLTTYFSPGSDASEFIATNFTFGMNRCFQMETKN